MKQVISLHGLWSRGKWQEETQRALEPYFQCESIKYKEYLWLGILKLVADPWVVWIMLLIGLGLADWWGAPTLAVVIALLCFVANRLARWKLARVVRNLKARIDGFLVGEQRPHLVAHSLGTYCIGQLLIKWPNVHLDHIVLTGCVLPRNFSWFQLRYGDLMSAFCQVRNEVGKKDVVSRLAALGDRLRLVSGFGSAGIYGFDGPSDLIHNINDPHVLCPNCEVVTLEPKVHNSFHSGFGHGDILIGPGHAGSFWLPFFWNIEPPEFRLFIRMSLAGFEFLEHSDNPGASLIERAFRTQRWRWTGGKLIDAYIGTEIRGKLSLDAPGLLSRAGTIDEILAIAIPRLWAVVARASSARRSGETEMRIIGSLHPRIAVRQAVAEGVRVWSWKSKKASH
jgi:hypothetical protein